MRQQTLFFVLGASVWGVAAILQPATAAEDTRAQVEVTPDGSIITPGSSIPLGPDSRTAHTNIHLFVPSGQLPGDTAPFGKFETPASLACVYGLTEKRDGCNPATLKTVATTGSRVVAIVDAYDDPTAAHDLDVYSKVFGLPRITKANFSVIYATGKKPQPDPTGGWELEESLDIEMAHALAPAAKILLVEAASSNQDDLLAAERVAAKLVEAAGGGEVSNSWGAAEYPQEASTAPFFEAHNVVFFASSGDSPGLIYPAVMPQIVAVGGTTIQRSGGLYTSQTSWSIDGGGISSYLPIPSFQKSVAKIVGKYRGVPDIAMVANPATGVWLYDTTPYNGAVEQWTVVGGTSAASPLAAAMLNSAGTFRASSAAELAELYAHAANKADFTDIIEGSCANASSNNVSVGYDLCTGIGAPLGVKGK